MNKINIRNLIEKNAIFESLFAPLYFKAKETHHDNPIIEDARSVEILELLEYDFSYFEKNTSGQFLISVRTKILDEQVSEFIDESVNPVIINLGAGLDTRYSRMPSDKIKYWYDLDLPEVIAFRKNFFIETDKHISIGKSVLDYSWIDDIDKDKSNTYLFIAEGLFMYFDEIEVKEILGEIGEKFPGSIMFCEVFHSKLINYNVQNKEKNKEISFKWGLTDTNELEKSYSDIHIEDEWRMFDYYQNRQTFLVRLLCMISSKYRDLVKILELRLGKI